MINHVIELCMGYSNKNMFTELPYCALQSSLAVKPVYSVLEKLYLVSIQDTF